MTTPNAWLSVKWGQGVEQIYPLAEESVVGRDPACAIVIPGGGAAPQQFLVRRKESGYWLAPIAESPSTYVNGMELKAAHRLRPGDEIAIPPEVIYVFQRAATGGDQVHLEEANFLLEQGDWQRALSEYEEALRLNPLLLTAYQKKALIFQAVGDFEHCLAECDRGLSVNRADAQLLFLRGKVRQGKGETEAALSDYTQAIQADASFAPAYEARAAVYLERNELTQARNDCDRAIKLKPQSDVAYNLRGLINHQQGRCQAAISDFSQAIRLDPNDPAPYYNRAFAYAKSGQLGHARKDFEKVMTLSQDQEMVENAQRFIAQIRTASSASASSGSGVNGGLILGGIAVIIIAAILTAVPIGGFSVIWYGGFIWGFILIIRGLAGSR
ncbi:MAG TPA: tetratricopeptide repeat protein [Anaerolineae bacterium]|nr:tetratricopeptide repeat protein [Anaerolineae bacterium]